MIEANADRRDNLARAVAVEVTDVHHAAELVQLAAVGENLSTLDRAAAMVELSAVRCRLDNLLDRLTGASLDLPDGEH